MSRHRLLLLLLLAAACAGVTGALWKKAFPIATLEFSVKRDEAAARLRPIVEDLGGKLDGYRSAVAFGEDSETKNFLELEHGVAKLEERTRAGLSIWQWQVRWFKPEQHEEFLAQLDPQGRFTGYAHTIEEERAGAELERDAAYAVAEDFLRRHVFHPAEKLRFVSDASTRRTHRLDWSFTWERDDLGIEEARYRLNVTVQGDAIGSYSEGLEVPEAWTRRFEEKREVNELCGTVAQWASMPLLVWFVVLFIVYARKRELRWRDVAPWGWLVLFAVSSLLTQIDSIPALLGSYATTQKWGSFLSEAGFGAVRSMLFTALGMWLVLLVTDPLYRELCPGQLSFRRALSRRALDDPRTLRALGMGILLAIAGTAYVTTFYQVGRRFGVWSPVEIDYTKTLTGWLPWAEAMNTGLTAAFGEELIFRVLGIGLYVKLLRRWPVALVLAGATWAFLHSSYPQMPGYIRGLELTVEGILWGWAMRRWGLVSTLTAHYLYDCWLGAYVVVQSSSWWDKVGALGVSLWPVALFGWCLWRQRQGRAVVELGEEIEDLAPPPPAQAEIPEAVRRRLQPLRLSPRWCWVLGAVGVLGCAAAWLPLPQDVFNHLGGTVLRRQEIGAKADALFQKHSGQQAARFHRVITLSTQTLPVTYLLEHGKLENVAALYGTEFPDTIWYVRYFRVMEREEFSVQLDKNGQMLSWNHSLPHEAPGAQLERDAALAVAKHALEQDYGFDLSHEGLVAEYTSEQPHRRDHSFTFERNGWEVGEARLRTRIAVQGDEPVSFQRWVQVPEAWSRAKAKSGWWKLAVSETETWVQLAKGVALGVLFILLFTRQLVPWRLGFLLALLPLALDFVSELNQAPWFFVNYITTTPLAHYLVRALGSTAVKLVMSYLSEVLQISVALGLLRWAFGLRPRDLLAARDGHSTVALALFTLGLFSLKTWVQYLATGLWFPDRVASFDALPVNAAWPWLKALCDAWDAGWGGVKHAILYASVVYLFWRRFPKLTIAFLLLQPLLDGAAQETWRESLYTVSWMELEMLFLVALLVFAWRTNAAVPFLYYFIGALLGWIAQFLVHGGPAYRWEAAPLVAAVVLALGAGWLVRSRLSAPA